MFTPWVKPHNAEPNLTFRLMSMFCYPAGKPDLKTALIHICQCSNNTFQIRASEDDTAEGISWMGHASSWAEETGCALRAPGAGNPG